MVRMIYIILFGLLSWAFNHGNLTNFGISFASALVIFLFIDFVVIKRVAFYKVLTTAIMAVLLLISLVVVLHLINIGTLFDLSYLPLVVKKIIVTFLILEVLYVSMNYGGSAHFFRKDKAEDESKDIFIMDTSAIIDGRVIDACSAGFLTQSLIIPEFVIREMQLIADSSIHEKRKKGRRGLNTLKKMKESDQLSINILSTDFDELRGVDNKLLALAKEVKGKVVTTDFNLVKVCEVEGVDVININKLATILKPQHSVNEKVKVHITKKGNSKKQGVGYLDDDTMVVIDDGEKFINQTKLAIVTAYIQSETGKMLFCKLI
jgi:uncharacterized protein YacL